MLEELWILLQTVLAFLATLPALLSGFLGRLFSTAAVLLEDLGQATGHADVLFLPAGRGASILALGGIAMVAISLSIALYIPQTTLRGSEPSTETDRPGPGTGRGDPWPRFSAAHADPMPDPAWLQGVRKAVAQNGLGEVVLLSERSGRRAVAITPCSRSEAGQGPPPCPHARELIRAGVRAAEPQGRVVPVSCTAQGGPACVFEVLTGGAPP